MQLRKSKLISFILLAALVVGVFLGNSAVFFDVQNNDGSAFNKLSDNSSFTLSDKVLSGLIFTGNVRDINGSDTSGRGIFRLVSSFGYNTLMIMIVFCLTLLFYTVSRTEKIIKCIKKADGMK